MEEGEIVEALDQRIGLRIDANGMISEMKEQLDFMSDHEDRIESLEGESIDDLKDEVGDLERSLDRMGDRVDLLENVDAPDFERLASDVSTLDSRVGDVLRMLSGINSATNDVNNLY